MTRDRFREILTPEIRALAKLFADEGHELYLVGGSVRDVLLERDVSDLDFTTRARPDDIERIGDIWASSLFLAGKDFGTIGLVHDGQVHEITTFRSEVYRGDSRKPSVTYGDSLTDDLSRRDFTVNAMALLVPTGADEDP